MKLCRFELLSQPGDVRSGLVYGGKIYETDGTNPIAVHEAADVRPLPPVGQAPSVRFFRFGPVDPSYEPEPLYTYGNPSSVVGASQIVPVPEFTSELDFEPYLALIVGEAGERLGVEEADRHILGFSVLTLLVARDAERAEARLGTGPGRSRDIAFALGPVLTTPDELDDAVQDDSAGRRYKLAAVARVNGVERRRGDVLSLRYTPAQAVAAASESCAVRPGDVIALGPIVDLEASPPPLAGGDEIQVAVERLGTLSTKLE